MTLNDQKTTCNYPYLQIFDSPSYLYSGLNYTDDAIVTFDVELVNIWKQYNKLLRGLSLVKFN